MKRFKLDRFLTGPPTLVILLLAANTAAFLLCVRAAGNPSITTSVLVAAGALVPAAARPGESWRLVAAGFLHANPAHLLTNLVSLALCGPFLERRLGASGFMLVYGFALVGAGLASVLLHPGPFVGVGASGAVFGILGALFALWVLGAPELSPGFFLVNFTLNFAFAARDSHIDWAAHIGGFTAGIAVVAVLDLAARANAFWLRCKFPEFIKTNTLLLAVVLGAYLWIRPPWVLASYDPRIVAAAVWVAAVLSAIKLIDCLLAARHGLATVVLVLAVGNGLTAYVASEWQRPTLESFCQSAADVTNVAALCGKDATEATYAVAAGALVLTLIVYASHLLRGLRDVGFVGATFVAERRRSRSLIR